MPPMMPGIEQYARYMRQRGMRAATVAVRTRILTYVEAVIGAPLLGATEQQLTTWRDGLVVCDSTVCTYLTTVRSFYRWAGEQGLVDSNPTARLPTPKLRTRLPRPIPERDLATAILTAPPRIKPWLVLAAYAGLRAQEICYLMATDLVLDGDTPHLIVSTKGAKGGKQRVVLLGTTVVTALRAAGLPNKGYVFLRADGQPGPNQPGRISQACNRHLRELGLSNTLHSLRHRYGTRLYALSQDILMVGGQMGHSDPKTTSGYIQASNPSAVAAVRALDVA